VSSNPALSDKVFERVGPAASQPGWGAPTTPIPPSDDPTSPWRPSTGTMTVNGSITATGVLLVLLCAGATVGWMQTEVARSAVGGAVANPPGWILATFFGAIAISFVAAFKPLWARVIGPIYALAMGTALGAISKVYNTEFEGIVVNAIGATIAVLAVMLFLHATRIVKVTERFRTVVMTATLAIAVVYGINLLLSFFDAQVPFIHDTGPLGIGISLVTTVVAALNLSLDFDFIERGTRARAPKAMEWYAGFALLTTLVWLYLELLRLLAKLQSRD
jgi:uncharacterized YccA/Bax inhibitor family protein